MGRLSKKNVPDGHDVGRGSYCVIRPLPNILKIVFLKVVAAFEMLDSLGFMAPLPNIRSQDFV